MFKTKPMAMEEKEPDRVQRYHRNHHHRHHIRRQRQWETLASVRCLDCDGYDSHLIWHGAHLRRNNPITPPPPMMRNVGSDTSAMTRCTA